ncbi:helix-hairpin-helix domain-containing protein [Bacillus sp. EB600]|uniref:helix-hairpin-helix domain-containing protein n=1 Tax=Bacillus sp. EB600 TaxID=2806345 RepID=UPI00210CBAC5|nr:helix-hairpin-helix domain-containing protein [Bacillus sp. EB600]MCQ6278172.1 helix-hairpin-helix domain-containing protein [Bacillus sp. EB600]
MKEWLAEHKIFLGAGVLLVLGSLYYFYLYQPQASTEQQLTGIGKNVASSDKKDNPASVDAVKDQKDQTKQPEKDETVIVDVKGEIKQPGIYHSNQMERVFDIIQRAGGLTDKADQSQVNFSAHVQDEMVIYIPAKGEANSSSPVIDSVPSGTTNSAGKSTGKININKADENELQNIPGIGPAKAAAIIQYRQENGPFKAVEDLKKISGIGDKTFEKLKESISI